MEKVLITGISSFLGSWTARFLDANGYKVMGISRENSNYSRINDVKRIHIYNCDQINWPKIIQSEKPKHVISFDWNGVGNKFRNDINQHNNLPRILSIAEACIVSQAETFTAFGSQAEIGPRSGAIREDAADNPTTEYGKAKVQAREELTKLFKNSNVKFNWGRIFSTYGALDTANWFIPDLIQTIKNGQIFEMTKGDQSWNYLHAYDFANAVRAVIESDREIGTVNIGSSNQVIIKDLAISIGKALGRIELIRIGAVPYRDDQVMELRPDITKIKSLGWREEVTIQSGINSTISWSNGADMLEMTSIDGTNLKIKVPTIYEILK